MDTKHNLVGGLAGLVLGSSLYIASADAATLSIQVGSKYVTCDTDQKYGPTNFCFDHVAAYNAQHPKTASSSSSSSSNPALTWLDKNEERDAARAYRAEMAQIQREAREKKGRWVCPK